MKGPIYFVVLALLVTLAAACVGQATPPPAPTVAPVAPVAPAAKPAAPSEAPKAAAPAAPAAKAPARNAIRIHQGTYPGTLDPANLEFQREVGVAAMLYEGLVQLDADLKPVPGQAEKWDVSADGLTYTFKLRPGLKYSDGQPLTAKNFEFAFKRAADPEVAGSYQSDTYVIEGAEAYGTADPKTTKPEDLQKLRDAMAVKATDDTTLVIKLVKKAAYFPYLAYMWFGYPVREDIVAKGEDWWVKGENHIGNGPFMIAELKEKEFIRFVPNPNWRGPKATAEEVVYRYVSDSKVAFEAYKLGELDIIPLVPEDFESVQRDPVLSQEVVRHPQACTHSMHFNQTRPPFNDKNARLAFAKSVDREAWAKDIFRSLAISATGWIAPGNPGHEPTAGADLKYDPVAAKAAWQKVNFSGEIKLGYSASARNTTRFQFIADQIQKSLGVTVTLDPTESTTYLGLLKGVETTPTVFVYGWCADFPDPQNWLTAYWRSTTSYAQRIGYKNPTLDKVLDEADAESDPARRIALYKQAEKIVLDDVAVSPIYVTELTYLVKPYVTIGKPTSFDAMFPGFFEPLKLALKR